jgi:hypothetical protein
MMQPCRECKTAVSTEAKTCPHCGVKQPTANMAAQRGLRRFCLAIIGVFVVGAMLTGKGENGSAATEAACTSDWTKCTDNADLANNWKDYRLTVAPACRRQADDVAKYGDPKWSWYSFGSFLPGDSAATKGVITAVDADVQFQNGFGAYGRMRVVCDYDLRQKKVLTVSVTDR